MSHKQGSILIQTLINLIIFAMFMHISFQSIVILSKPISINHLKYEYIELQLQYIASLYNGASIINGVLCFNEDHCLEVNNHRLILTPGYQILLENIESYIFNEQEESFQLKVLHLNEWVIFNVRK